MEKFDLNRMWKDLQDSAREFASYGLQLSSKAIEATAATLSTVKDELAKTAEKLSPKGEAETTAPSADEQPKQ
jgi:hypothetical protein